MSTIAVSGHDIYGSTWGLRLGLASCLQYHARRSQTTKGGAMEKPVTIEQTLEMMTQMSEEERGAYLAECTEMCICESCPTYEDTGETKLLFCVHGSSDIITEDKGCPCRECPLTQKMGLRWNDYCLKGSAEERLAQEE
jgi:hypothetical protein